jgi:hypothetical protein
MESAAATTGMKVFQLSVPPACICMALLVVLQLDYLEDPGVNERVILKLIIKK